MSGWDDLVCIYPWPMDTDNRAERSWGGEQEWAGAGQWGKQADICNSFNNKELYIYSAVIILYGDSVLISQQM